MTASAIPNAPTWSDIFVEPFTTLILGQRGSGKTALGHLLLEQFSEPRSADDRTAYIMGFPEQQASHLPGWMEVLPETTGMNEWPADSTVLLHEAHHLIHARRSMNAKNIKIDDLVTVSRHKNSNIIFETQQSQRLDRNAVTAVDGVIFREPALLQSDFERNQMQTLVQRADAVFEQYTNTVETESFTWREKSDDVKTHAYVYSGRFDGEYPHEIPLPDHWSEEISKAYGDETFSQSNGDTKLGDSGLTEDEQAALDAVAEWETENRPLDWSHNGANHNVVSLPRAWEELLRLHGSDLLEVTYESSNKPKEYRLTEEGWRRTSVDEPDCPLLSDQAEN
jgi:hypothetical protein